MRGRIQRPVAVVLRAFGDPFAQSRDLGIRERQARVGRRHPHALIRRGDAAHEGGGIGISLTMALRPPPRSALASSSLSSRNGTFFAAASGPWHVKHLSARIGRTSRLNSTPALAMVQQRTSKEKGNTRISGVSDHYRAYPACPDRSGARTLACRVPSAAPGDAMFLRNQATAPAPTNNRATSSRRQFFAR